MKRNSINFWLDTVSFVIMLALAFTGCLIYFILPPGTGHTHTIFGLGRHDFGTIHLYLAIASIVLLILHIILHWNWICIVVGKAFGNPKCSKNKQTVYGIIWLFASTLGFCIVLCLANQYVEIDMTKQVHFDANHQLPHDRKVELFNQKKTRKNSRTNSVNSRPQNDSPNPTPTMSKYTRSQSNKKEQHHTTCPKGETINGRTTLIEASVKCKWSAERLRDFLQLPQSVKSHQRLGRLKRRYGISIDEIRKIVCNN